MTEQREPDAGADVAAPQVHIHLTPDDRDLGGDPACWLSEVCAECGRLIEDRFAEVCPRCGTPRETA